jgi:hypothetical protein
VNERILPGNREIVTHKSVDCKPLGSDPIARQAQMFKFAHSDLQCAPSMSGRIDREPAGQAAPTSPVRRSKRVKRDRFSRDT